MSSHEIVIVGANQGGIPMAHYLLKHTIPQLQALDSSRKYHVTMLSPNTSYYWKIAGPRALVSHEQMPIKSIMKPIADAFVQYPSSSWSHAQGKATSINSEAKTIAVTLTVGGLETLKYDSLILATGTHYDSALWSTEYGTEATVAAQKEMQKSLADAKSILIAGGGPVGLETAGEIAVAYPGKKITLVSGGKTVLERMNLPNVSKAGEAALKKLNVEVVNNMRIKETKKSGNETVITYADGTEVIVDAYVNAFAKGPNVDYVPEAWVEKGHVKTDKDTLRVPEASLVYAIGDIHSNSNKQSMSVGDSVGVVGSSLALDVLSTSPKDEKAAAQSQNTGFIAWLLSLFGIGSGAKNEKPVQKKYKTMDLTQVIPIGRSGTGAIMGYKIPGWFAYMIKGKTYMVEMAEAQANGPAWAKP